MSTPDGFKRPKEYLPHMAMVKTPKELLMSELGLDHNDLKAQTSSSESEEEVELPVGTVSTPTTHHRCASGEVISLQQMLSASQRKLRQAQSSLQDSEQRKNSRLKMLRKTHQSAMSMKQRLITDLQDILQEREELIRGLEARLRTGGGHTSSSSSSSPSSKPAPLSSNNNSPASSVKRLVDQVTKQHKELLSLEGKYEESRLEVEQLRAARQALEDELIMAKDLPVKLPARPGNMRLVKQVQELEEKVRLLEQQKEEASLSHAEALKKLRTLESEAQKRALADEEEKENQQLTQANIKLGEERTHLQAMVRGLEESGREAREESKALGEECGVLREECGVLREECGVLREECGVLREECGVLREECGTLREECGVLREENGVLREENGKLKDECGVLREECGTLKGECGVLKEECGVLKGECGVLRERLASQEQIHSSEVSRLKEQVIEMNRKKFEAERLVLQGRCEELEEEVRAAREALGVALEEARGHARAEALHSMQSLRESVLEAHLNSEQAKSMLDEVRGSVLCFTSALAADLADTQRKVVDRISSVSLMNSRLASRYRREMQLRKRLHNQLVELRGNIRVLCRVRPPILEDGSGPPAQVVVEVDGEDDGVLRVLSRGSWKTFDLDKVFGSTSTQEQVFEEVKSLVTSCMDGYNVCIFAYGQTGSGKTFTMEGPEDNPGINQRALQELFSLVEGRSADWRYSIVVSVLEIYNETVCDLLARNRLERLEVKQGPEGVYVPGLTQIQVNTLEEVNEVFDLGRQNRSTGATRMNIESSRSHALLCVSVVGHNLTTGIQTFGKLNLIDLAGSERLDKSGSDGARLLEARHINKSLSALGDVIYSLRSKSQHTPYRNSKLTYILQDSLSGESKTLMVVQIAPVEKNAGETVCSLNFAQRVRGVELGPAHRKVMGAADRLRDTVEASPRSPAKASPRVGVKLTSRFQ